MKKLIILSTAILALSSGYAIAQDGGPQGGPGGPGGPDGHNSMQKKLDTDGDGVVSEAEFLAHAKERFNKIDKDGSGSITKEEGRAAHKHMRERRKENMGEMKERREKRQSERPVE